MNTLMPDLHSCLQIHLSVTTSLSQSLMLRSSEILISEEKLRNQWWIWMMQQLFLEL